MESCLRTGFVHFVTFIGALTLACGLFVGTVALIRECYSAYIYRSIHKMDKKIDKNIDRLLKDMYDGEEI